jgi:peptidyl-prolyl cis-trans isomerase D
MRKNQRWLMIFISVIVIIAFVFLYNQTDLDKLGSSSVGSIYGRNVDATEYGRLEKQFQIAQGLGMMDLLQALVGRGSQDPLGDYVWGTLILREKARLLQIEPTTEAITKRIQELPPFQKDGQFDFQEYQSFMVNTLTPRGFGEKQLEELVADDLRLSKLRDLVGSSAVTLENEVRDAYGNAFRKRHLQVVKFPRSTFEAAAAVSAEEIKAHYEENKDTFKTEEKRVVKYAAFKLPEDQKKLTGKERVTALQPISTQADTFSQQLLKPGANFDAIAKELNVPVQETPAFSMSSPPAEIASVPRVGPTVFNLSTEVPDSDVLQTEDAFYIFHLVKVEPAVPQTLEEATPKITSTLKEEKISTAMTLKGSELQKSLQAAIKGGQTFTQAAEAAGLKVETVPPFSPAEVQQSQDFSADRILQMRTGSLAEGAVSELIPTMDGGALAYLEKLEPLDEEKWKKDREGILDNYASGRREAGFSEWFRAQRATANIRSGATAG